MEQLGVTTIVVVVVDIYICYYYYYDKGHKNVTDEFAANYHTINIESAAFRQPMLFEPDPESAGVRMGGQGRGAK